MDAVSAGVEEALAADVRRAAGIQGGGGYLPHELGGLRLSGEKEVRLRTVMRLLNGRVPECVARLRWGVDDVQATRSARTARRRRETEPK